MAYTTINDPEAHFQVKIYTGTGDDAESFTLDGDTAMQPDLVWIKNRGAAAWHNVYDSLRGVNKAIARNDPNTEESRSDTFDSFDSDGFTLGNDASQDPDGYNTNADGHTYVAFCWKANGTGSSNTAGSINTTATSANTTSGFSIVTYTGDEGSSATLGHGLGAVPKYIVTKGRTYASSWATFHASHGATKWFQGSETDTVADASTIWNDTEPTSTLFTVGSSNQVNDDFTYVAYCFAEKQGFSKFGSYTGNGASADGTFVYTGFKPAWVMTKSSSNAVNWAINDNKTAPYNLMVNKIAANTAAAQDTGSENTIDFLSNGFKPRGTGSSENNNGNGYLYIYAAFAEAPFVNSNGVPCNAR